MNTYHPTLLATGLLSDEPLEPFHLGYLHARIQNNAHDCVLQVFIDEAEERGINKAYIARRLKKRPEVVGRCLTAPGNWTLDTVAELLGSMGYEVEFRARSLRNPALPNRIHDVVINQPNSWSVGSSAQPAIAFGSGAIQPSAHTIPVSVGENIRVTSTR